MGDTAVEIKTVYEIDLNGKYIILIEGRPPVVELERLKTRLDYWLANDEPFMLINGDSIKLVKVK